jgi:hypothetical protein
MTSTFDTTLQQLEATERFEQALTRVRAVCEEKLDGWRLASEERGYYTKNGMLAEIYKALVYSAPLARFSVGVNKGPMRYEPQRTEAGRISEVYICGFQISQFCRKCIAAAHRTEYVPLPE